MSETTNVKTILIVDDEEMVLALGRIILERHGYNVRAAATGPDALAVCRDTDVPIDCAVVDFSMPGMSGRETVEEIRKIFPQLPVLISSGHSDQQIERDMHGIPIHGVIRKPYRRETLIEIIESAVGKD